MSNGHGVSVLFYVACYFHYRAKAFFFSATHKFKKNVFIKCKLIIRSTKSTKTPFTIRKKVKNHKSVKSEIEKKKNYVSSLHFSKYELCRSVYSLRGGSIHSFCPLPTVKEVRKGQTPPLKPPVLPPTCESRIFFFLDYSTTMLEIDSLASSFRRSCPFLFV